MDIVSVLNDAFFSLDVAVSPLYLLGFVAVAAVIYLARRETGGFLAWLLPRHIWTHKSTRLDLVLFVMGRLMSAFGLLARFGATPVVAQWVAVNLPWQAAPGANLSPVMLALLFWLANDFAVYWVHRIHHQTRILWPLHAVHHSAEVMTPFTAYRQHPFGLLIVVAIQSCIMGAVLGCIVGTLDPQASMLEIAGANAFTVIAILAMANFHHAHIWISYGPVLERLFISPAQHQIHHSNAPAHYNRNFGGMLAIWDWMFGTLYVTGPREDLVLGLSDESDAPLMTHRLDLTLIDPMRRFFTAGR